MRLKLFVDDKSVLEGLLQLSTEETHASGSDKGLQWTVLLHT